MPAKYQLATLKMKTVTRKKKREKPKYIILESGKYI